jgi:23S rRNA (uridine2479-2'-O)-methyltransferase
MAAAARQRIHAANDAFQLALSLQSNRKQRRRQGRFVVEGVRNINAAVDRGWPIDSFWYSGERRLSDWARSLLEASAARTIYDLHADLLAQLSQREEPSELIALVRMPPDDLARVPVAGADTLLLAFDRPVSPGNLCAVIRSCDALGAHGVAVTGHGADVYDPQTVRASAGSLFRLPVVHAGAMAAVAGWIERLRGAAPGLLVLGTSAAGGRPVQEQDLAGPVLVVLGNETHGLGYGWRQQCDELVTIPLRGEADSLNVAAAAAIVLYEIDRQRRERAA